MTVDPSLRPREEGRLRRGTGLAGVLPPLRAAGGWGVPAESPGAEADPLGHQDPVPYWTKSLTPWEQGTGAAGAAGLPAAGAGGGIPAPQSEARCLR